MNPEGPVLGAFDEVTFDAWYIIIQLLLIILLNKSFWTVALRTQISMFTSSRGKSRLSKDEQFISAYFDTSFIEIHLQMPEI